MRQDKGKGKPGGVKGRQSGGGRARRGERSEKGRRRRRWGRVIMPVACTVAQRRPKPAITHHILNSSASGQHLACHLLLLPLRRLYLLPSPVAGSLLSSYLSSSVRMLVEAVHCWSVAFVYHSLTSLFTLYGSLFMHLLLTAGRRWRYLSAVVNKMKFLKVNE